MSVNTTKDCRALPALEREAKKAAITTKPGSYFVMETLLCYREGKLENKVSLVTGGGAVIGRTIAETFGRLGAKVIIADIKSE